MTPIVGDAASNNGMAHFPRGNCGSPIELDGGWLLLTHGVGPVRRDSISAVLLDKANPAKVLARSCEPLVQPEPFNRDCPID